MKNNKQIALEKFDIFIEWISKDLLNERQIEMIEDCRRSLESDFDSEITYLDNCQRLSEML
ncbi:MAG: hypothetical protein KIT33_15930 [Candidatus Kapabacteria bacterium]|nr:hypothetical protein [Ignavibacteriota bacterium]MCW5886461.1 hypothetical protein [Candidatus Kapabacteria bacterium]